MFHKVRAGDEHRHKRREQAKAWLTRIEARFQVFFGRFVIRGKPSLVNRLFAFLVIGALVIYFIVLVGLYLTSSHLVEDNLRRHAQQWIAEMDELGMPLYFTRKTDLRVIEKRIDHFSEIHFVRYYDSSGKRVLAELGQYEDRPAQPLTGEQMRKLAAIAKTETPYLFDTNDSEYLRVISSVRVRSIRSDGLLNFNFQNGAEDVKVIGYIDLAIDPSSYRTQMLRSFVFGGGMSALILLFAVIVGRRLIRSALLPLTELQTPLARLARGEIDVGVTPGGDREIAAIADALNVTIGALKERNEALRRLAEHDALTGLFNRNYFSRALDAELAWVKRRGKPSALIFIDLDRFKTVNDTLGHGAGDRLLVEVASRIKTRMRGQDIVARFGGDEFAIVAHDATREDVINVAKSIHEILLSYHFVESEHSFTISCTIGIAMITPYSRDAEEVLLHADSACYTAKAKGRNRYCLYEPDQQQKLGMASDMGWSQRIKDAIKEDGFVLVYQPIVSLAEHKQDYYEVLLRMQDTSGEALMPESFLPIAERFGLLAEIDSWVIAHAMKALAKRRDQGRDTVFCINLSGQAITDPSVIELIKDTLTANALPASAVIFEITEQTAVRYIDKARHLAQKLLDLGCRFAIDDFGVGFSSFAHLKRLPVSLIKIDRSFIESLPSEIVDQHMVKGIAQAAKALGKEVIAEFVQDEATIDLLKSYGVDFAQGNHLGKPAGILPRQPLLLVANADKRRSGTGSD